MWGPYNPCPGAYGPDDPGGGDYNPESGLRLWYNPPTQNTDNTEAMALKWVDILTHWPEISLDLHTIFHIDTESDVLDTRTWPWLEARILDLINQPSRLRTALRIPDNLTI